MTQGALDPVSQRLELLLMGGGFNYYRKENLARADDLLIRNRAANAISESSATLTNLSDAYARQYLPPPTRDHPFPSREHLDRAGALKRERDRLGVLASTVRGMPVPTQDKIWRRVRTEIGLLTQLLSVDYDLISLADELRESVATLTVERALADEAPQVVDPLFQRLEATLRTRQMILQFH